MALLTSEAPRWLQDLRERKKQMRAESKITSVSSRHGSSSPVSPGGKMLYIVNNRQNSLGTAGSRIDSSVSETNYINGDGFTADKLEIDVFSNSLSPRSMDHKFYGSVSKEANAKGKVISGSDSNGLLSEVSDTEDEEFYQPGFVKKLRSKWAKRVGDLKTRRLSGEISESESNLGLGQPAISPANSLESRMSVSNDYSETASKPQGVKRQLKKANSLENFVDYSQSKPRLVFNKSTENFSHDSRSSSTSNVDTVKNDNLQEKSLLKVSKSTPNLNGDGLIKALEPERVDGDDELPRPNTVLAALSMFEKPGIEKRHWKTQIATRPKSPLSEETKQNINSQVQPKIFSTVETAKTEVINGSTVESSQFTNRFVKSSETTVNQEKTVEPIKTPRPELNGSSSLQSVTVKKVADSRKTPSSDSQRAHVVFDFRHDDPDGVRKPVVHKRRGTGSRPTSISLTNNDSVVNGNETLKLDLSALDEPSEDDTSWMDMNPQPCSVQFVGAEVKTNKSALKRQASSKTGRVQFCSASPAEFEYQSEESLLQELGIVHESTLLEMQEQKREQARLREQREQRAKLKQTPGGGVTAGELGNYRTKQALDYQFGQHLTEEQEGEQNRIAQVYEPTVDDVTVTPAAEQDHVTWSGNATSDILF